MASEEDPDKLKAQGQCIKMFWFCWSLECTEVNFLRLTCNILNLCNFILSGTLFFISMLIGDEVKALDASI